ncbi:MAG: DUF2273 domain-containing protein [Firmicutes bacterium]|nr:DUF2273 domain-containing protein [Bacillota bacterium]
MDDRNLTELLKRYKWTILLAVAALIFAVSVITYGFFKTLFLFVCLGLGVWGGLFIDRRAKEKKDPSNNE